MRLSWVVLVLAFGVVAFAAKFWRAVDSPESHILCSENGAEWIRVDQPVDLVRQAVVETGAAFRYPFRLSRPVPEGILTVRAMKNVLVALDDKPIYADPPGFRNWMRQRQVALPQLAEGVHVLDLVVHANDCHPAALAYCESLGITTGAHWGATLDGHEWHPAMLARTPHLPEIAESFPFTYTALARVAPWLGLVFGVVGAWSVLHERRAWPAPRPSVVRWLFLAVWVALAANDISKLPAYVGMDLDGHIDYIRYVADKRQLPLATDGWQMFQSPLYYLVSAPLYWCLAKAGTDHVQQWLRIIPLLCGLTQVELCYRAMRSVFPQRGDLQIVGTALGGFLPMNLYMSQVVGNEPMAGMLSSLAFVVFINQIQRGRSCFESRFAILLGAACGLALLAKATALLLTLVLVVFGTWWSLSQKKSAGRLESARRIPVAAAGFGGALFVISGWYYLRNWVLLGRPFVGGWDPARGIAWWQDHGYIALPSLMTFGRALVHPIYAQTAGIWDGLYCTFWLDGSLSSIVQFKFRPPWDYDFVLSSALLAVIPCCALAWGAIRKIAEPVFALSVVCIAVYVGAIFSLHLFALPIYSTIKGTYLLGLLPCFAILAAAGMDGLPRNVWIRAVAHGLFASWAVSVYLGYLII